VEITTNVKEMQGVTRDYFENLYSNELENLEEMDKYLDIYDHSKQKQEDVNHLNRFATHNEIEGEIRNLPKKKSLGPDRFSAEFYQTFKEKLIPTFFKLFYEIESEGKLPNSFFEASITLVPKPDKGTCKRKITRPSP
jgi:hypothetical protein